MLEFWEEVRSLRSWRTMSKWDNTSGMSDLSRVSITNRALWSEGEGRGRGGREGGKRKLSGSDHHYYP